MFSLAHPPSFYFLIRYLTRTLQLSVMYHKTMLRNSLKCDVKNPTVRPGTFSARCGYL